MATSKKMTTRDKVIAAIFWIAIIGAIIGWNLYDDYRYAQTHPGTNMWVYDETPPECQPSFVEGGC